MRSPQLFLIPILHQTTTDNRVLSLHSGCSSFQFYIKPQLSPAIPRKAFCCSSFQFYIKPQRSPALPEFPPGCSSFQFYIKPQHGRPLMEVDGVVPHSNSTSNHNAQVGTAQVGTLFLIPILHQTTTLRSAPRRSAPLFLIPILHQTTTSRMAVIHILHVTHMTPMHKTSCRTPGKLVGCNFVFQRAIYQKNSSC